jgi:hypothetical protein
MCAALARDAGIMAVAVDDGTVRVHTALGDLTELIRMPCLGFLDDIDVNSAARLVAVLQPDERITVWDMDTGEPRCATLSGSGDRPLAISDDGNHVFVGLGRARGRVPVSHDELAALVRRPTNRVLTAEERAQHLGEEPDLTRERR